MAIIEINSNQKHMQPNATNSLTLCNKITFNSKKGSVQQEKCCNLKVMNSDFCYTHRTQKINWDNFQPTNLSTNSLKYSNKSHLVHIEQMCKTLRLKEELFREIRCYSPQQTFQTFLLKEKLLHEIRSYRKLQIKSKFKPNKNAKRSVKSKTSSTSLW